MKPLSIMKFYTHNKKRLALLVIPVLLCTMAVFLIQSLISSYMIVQYKAFVETRKSYTGIQARGNPIDLDMIEVIRQNENTEKIVPCVQDYTEMTSILDQVGVRVYLLKTDDLMELMGRMKVSVVQGRLPQHGENGIVLHKAVADNKGLAIGDEMGNEVDPAERLLGRYRIVGLLDGPALCGFASLEDWQARVKIDKPQEYGILIYPKPGRLAELNKYIQYLPLAGNDVSSYSTSTDSLTESGNKINSILNIIYISLLLIIALCVGFLTYLFYINRAREFAIQNIIGYSRRAILKLNLLDILVINFATAVSAIIISAAICLVLNITTFNSMGIPLPLLDGQTLLLCACVPLVSVIAETMAVSRALGGMDAISLLESEN